MSKNNISDELIITTSARLSNEVGLNNLSLKMIAEELNIKSPSLYNHISSLDDIKEKLMIYGWKELGEKATESAVGVAGYEALRNMCYAFYDYATNNKGVFTAMLWYNKFESEEKKEATIKLFSLLFRVLQPLNISDNNIEHIIRTLRGFLEGFVLLVNNNAFGSSLAVSYICYFLKRSFSIFIDLCLVYDS